MQLSSSPNVKSFEALYGFHVLLFSLNPFIEKPLDFDTIPTADVLFIFGQLSREAINKIQQSLVARTCQKIVWFADEGDLEACAEHNEFFSEERVKILPLQNPDISSFECVSMNLGLDFATLVLHKNQTLDDYAFTFSQKYVLFHYVKQERDLKKLVLKHVFQNLKDEALWYDIKPLKEVFKGATILILGAGSSFDDYRKTIKKLSSKVIVMALGSANALCFDHGIDVDIACCVCPNEEAWSRLQGKLNSKILLSSPRCHSEVFGGFLGPKLVMPMIAQSGFSHLAQSLGECPVLSKMPLESSTVLSLGLSAALYLGFSQVILAGCDLGTKEKQYASGVNSDWAIQRFLPEKVALETIALKSKASIYFLGSESPIKGVKPFSACEALVRLEDDEKPSVDHLVLTNHPFDKRGYARALKTSLKECLEFCDHPFFEIMVEDKLAFSEVLKDEQKLANREELLELVSWLEEF